MTDPVSLDDCQKAFEAWYTKKFLGVNLGTALEWVNEYGYRQLDTQFCWLGWQAGWEAKK
jgi:hypothetical protein